MQDRRVVHKDRDEVARETRSFKFHVSKAAVSLRVAIHERSYGAAMATERTSARRARGLTQPQPGHHLHDLLGVGLNKSGVRLNSFPHRCFGQRPSGGEVLEGVVGTDVERGDVSLPRHAPPPFQQLVVELVFLRGLLRIGYTDDGCRPLDRNCPHLLDRSTTTLARRSPTRQRAISSEPPSLGGNGRFLKPELADRTKLQVSL